MSPEEKVLSEIKERLSALCAKITELKVTEDERRAFEKEKADYQVNIDDYKKHRDALIEREKRLNGN